VISVLFLLSENFSGGYYMTLEILANQEEQLKKQQALATLREAVRLKTRILKALVYGVETLEFGGQKQQALALSFNGIFGYIPASKIDDYEFKGLQSFVGTELEFIVESLFEPEEEPVTEEQSGETALVSDEKQQGKALTHKKTLFLGNRAAALEIQAERFWKNLKTNGVNDQVYEAFVSGVDKANVWLVVEGMRVRMNRMNYSYKFYDDLRLHIFIGDKIQVKVLDFKENEDDGEAKRTLTVSRKVLERNPKDFLTNIKVKGTYLAVVKNIDVDKGVFVELDPFGITVLVGFPSMDSGIKLAKEKQVNVRVTRIDTKTGFVSGVIFDPKGRRRSSSVVH